MPDPDLQQALEDLSSDGTVAAYVLGCGKTTDLIVASTGRSDVQLRFWVGGTMMPIDRRFVAP